MVDKEGQEMGDGIRQILPTILRVDIHPILRMAETPEGRQHGTENKVDGEIEGFVGFIIYIKSLSLDSRSCFSK